MQPQTPTLDLLNWFTLAFTTFFHLDFQLYRLILSQSTSQINQLHEPKSTLSIMKRRK